MNRKLLETIALLEKARRGKILHKIIINKRILSGDRMVTTSKVGYVLGRYHPNNNVYEYLDLGLWVADLNTVMLPASTPEVLQTDGLEKHYKYSTSKVFYKLIRPLAEDPKLPNLGYICTIKLTKPNFFEKLTAMMQI